MPGFNIGRILNGCNIKFGNDSKNIISNTIETARTNRFELSLSIPINNARINKTVFSDKIVTLSCQSITRPIIEIEKEVVYNGADYINVPLRAKYSPVNVVFYEILSGSDPTNEINATASDIVFWWTQGAWNRRSSRTTYPESRRTTASISMLTGIGTLAWKYTLYRCWPETITPTILDYENGSISKIELSLVYDKFMEGYSSELTPSDKMGPN